MCIVWHLKPGACLEYSTMCIWYLSVVYTKHIQGVHKTIRKTMWEKTCSWVWEFRVWVPQNSIASRMIHYLVSKTDDRSRNATKTIYVYTHIAQHLRCIVVKQINAEKKTLLHFYGRTDQKKWSCERDRVKIRRSLVIFCSCSSNTIKTPRVWVFDVRVCVSLH